MPKNGKKPSPRRDGREAAVQFLYACDMQSEIATDETGMQQFWEVRQIKTDLAREFATMLVTGIDKQLSEVDGRIRDTADNFALHKLNPVDRNILRVAVYEICFCDHIPREAAINEAIEIAKRMGSDESPGFINGVLDGLPEVF